MCRCLTTSINHCELQAQNGMALERTSNSFHWADYVILVLSLLISCSVGIYFALSGGKQKTTAEYLMGDRSMRLVPVSVSLVASFLSAILILGHPAEIYLNGIGFHFHLLGVTVAYVLSAVLFVRLFYPLRLTSVFEYLDKRFNSKLARCIGTILSLILMPETWIGGQLAQSKTKSVEQSSTVTNNAVRREYVIAACGIIGTFYTLLGGMKAVVWVDAIQAGIMLIGVLSVAIKAVVDSGGLASVWQLNMDYDRIQLPSWTLDPRERHSMWGMVLGSAVYWLSSIGVSQAAVQRLCSLPSMKSARMSLVLGLAGHFLMVSACTLVGMAVFSRYASVGCDIHAAGWADTNQIITYYVMERMNVPGFPGLFTSALLAAALSSVSSSLSSASTIAWTDLLRPYACKNLTEGQATVTAKVLVALFGLIGIAIAYLAAQLGGTIIQAVSTFLGAIIGPSLGLILLASLFPSANWFGASISPFAGVAFGIWIGAGSYANKKQLVKLAANVTGCNTLAAGSFAATNSSETEVYDYYSSTTSSAVGTEKGRHFGFVEPMPVREDLLLPGVAKLWRLCGCSGNLLLPPPADDSENIAKQTELSLNADIGKTDPLDIHLQIVEATKL
uniref:Sodium-coupled monocarboxylate transporter 1 n=1 Tax=Macrostomum lignano TaxID=282301 RepID=A0A1I8JBY3_9PLAT